MIMASFGDHSAIPGRDHEMALTGAR